MNVQKLWNLDVTARPAHSEELECAKFGGKIDDPLDKSYERPWLTGVLKRAI